MRDHAEIGDAIWWGKGPWLWSVYAIIEVAEGPRLLAITHGDTEADIVTRIVPETDVTSNAFQLP